MLSCWCFQGLVPCCNYSFNFSPFFSYPISCFDVPFIVHLMWEFLASSWPNPVFVEKLHVIYVYWGLIQEYCRCLLNDGAGNSCFLCPIHIWRNGHAFCNPWIQFSLNWPDCNCSVVSFECLCLALCYVYMYVISTEFCTCSSENSPSSHVHVFQAQISLIYLTIFQIFTFQF